MTHPRHAPAPADHFVVDSLAKSFGPSRALTDCSLGLAPGEVHAIMGENGSGKSTLVKILSGVHRPDAGRMSLAGRDLTGLRSPADALSAGIATVFQEVLVAPQRSVLTNVLLGIRTPFRSGGGPAELRARAENGLAMLLDSPPSLDTPVERLTLSEQQACCIARSLIRDPKLLILDEATSALDVSTRAHLFDVVRRLSDEGTSVLFISHRMDEVEELADRITVLRSGRSVTSVERGKATVDQLVRHMTGSGRLTSAEPTDQGATQLDGRMAPAAPGTKVTDKTVVMRGEALRLRKSAGPIDFALKAGEIVGLAGLEGHGQDAFLKTLAGFAQSEGRVVVPGGRADSVCTPHGAAAEGVAYLPRDRRGEALFDSKSVLANFELPSIPRDRRAGLLRLSRTARRFAPYVPACPCDTPAASSRSPR